MTQRTDRPRVGLRPVVDRLVASFDSAAASPVSVLLQGAEGSGRASSVEALLERLAEQGRNFALWRIASQPGDDGLRSLMRAFGGFVTGLARTAAFGDADPGDLLDQAALSAADERVRGWLQHFASCVRDVRVHGGGELQIKLPQQNPWLALLYAWDVLGQRTSWVVHLHDLVQTTSPSLWAFLSAMLGRARARRWRVLFLVAPGDNLWSEQPGDEAQPGPAAVMRSLFADAVPLPIPPLAAAEVAELLDETYRPNSFPPELAPRLLELSLGHPDTLHEILDVLEDDETITWDQRAFSLSSMEDVDMDVLVPLPIESAEEDAAGSEGGDEDGEGAGEAGDDGPSPSLMERILQVAALEGPTFSASAIRSVLRAGEDEVDDALDAMPHIVQEAEYHKALGTWTYRFRYRFWQRWYRDNAPADARTKPASLARDLATLMMQSYAPASFEYIPRAARSFALGGDGRGARNMLAMAVGSERSDLLGFGLEVVQRFPDSPWPPGLVRLLHTRLADRAAGVAKPEDARNVIESARAWARAEQDAGTLAWLQLLECRLAVREGDFGRARTLGEAALAAFEKAGDRTRAGETLNQLAMVALNLADAAAAEAYVRRAAKATTLPPVKAHSEYIQGLLLKRRGQAAAAYRAFEQAWKLGEQSGNLVLSLEAILNLGETGIVSGKGKELALPLERALEMSRAMRTVTRERVAARLLCQAEAARGNAGAALEMARHALELTREIGKGGGESIDLYHCGVFSIVAGKADEGLDFLLAAKAAAEAEGNTPLLPEILLNVGQVRIARADWEGARTALEQALALSRERKDRGREIRILEHLGQMLAASGDHLGAAARYREAADRALGPQAKQLRRDLRKRMAQEQRKAGASVEPEDEA